MSVADHEAERAVLGCCLLSTAAVLIAAEKLRPGDFSTAEHRQVFSAMVVLARLGRPVDAETLRAELLDRKQLEAVGGMRFVLELLETVATAANVAHYAERVASKARLRRFIETTEALRQQAAETDDPDAFMLESQQQLLGASDLEGGKGVESAAVWANAVAQEMEREAEAGEESGLTTGYYVFDRWGGWRKESLIVLGARPSMGKTALALNIALNVARAGGNVMAVSLEMGRRQIGERLIATLAGIDTLDLRRTRDLFSGARWSDAYGALRQLSEMHLHLWAPGGCTADEIRMRAKRLHVLHPLSLVVVDYVQLVTGEGRSREERIGSVSRALKLLAMELGIPVLCLAQLNREIEKRDVKVPQLSDLRDSGSLEQDADVVAFLHRPHAYDDTADPERAEVYVEKDRHGKKCQGILKFDGRYQRFTDA